MEVVRIVEKEQMVVGRSSVLDGSEDHNEMMDVMVAVRNAELLPMAAVHTAELVPMAAVRRFELVGSEGRMIDLVASMVAVDHN